MIKREDYEARITDKYADSACNLCCFYVGKEKPRCQLLTTETSNGFDCTPMEIAGKTHAVYFKRIKK